jgi:hypothetical protein
MTVLEGNGDFKTLFALTVNSKIRRKKYEIFHLDVYFIWDT